MLTPDESSEATFVESAPLAESPHVTTEPSCLRAAKAVPLEKIWLTPELSDDET